MFSMIILHNPIRFQSISTNIFSYRLEMSRNKCMAWMVCHDMSCKVLFCDVKCMWVVANGLKHAEPECYTQVLYDRLLTHRLHTYTVAHGVIDIHNVLTLNSQPRHPLLENWVVLCPSAGRPKVTGNKVSHSGFLWGKIKKERLYSFCFPYVVLSVENTVL